MLAIAPARYLHLAVTAIVHIGRWLDLLRKLKIKREGSIIEVALRALFPKRQRFRDPRLQLLSFSIITSRSEPYQLPARCNVSIAYAMERAWYSHITIDLIVQVLGRSLFHPFVAWLVPLCLRAIATPYHAPDFIASCTWAAVLTLLAALGVLNRRTAYGTPREVDWNEEVVVITGGAGGLGKILAEIYGMRGASVAVLDVQKPDKESEGLARVHFYICDVGDAAAVAKAGKQVEKDLGTPTILVNNAGIMTGKVLLELETEEVQRNFNTNLLSHFYTIRTFLPGMLASEVGGTIVTVSSVLGKLGASHLSDYAAAKAGLIAMHSSLRAELASPYAPDGAENIRTILVTPGQLNTRLFERVETPNAFFGPVVEPVELARKIASQIDAGENGDISVPLYARWLEWMHVLPVGVQKLARWVSGVDRAMEDLARSENKSSRKADQIRDEKS